MSQFRLLLFEKEGWRYFVPSFLETNVCWKYVSRTYLDHGYVKLVGHVFSKNVWTFPLHLYFCRFEHLHLYICFFFESKKYEYPSINNFLPPLLVADISSSILLKIYIFTYLNTSLPLVILKTYLFYILALFEYYTNT